MTNELNIALRVEPGSQTEALEIIKAVEAAMRKLGYVGDRTLHIEMKVYPPK